MLYEFISQNRNEILRRTRERVALRLAPRPTAAELSHGIPQFLDQMVQILQGDLARGLPSDPALGPEAVGHAGERMNLGFTVDQLVHDYGDVCQAITELAIDAATPISPDEFRVLNKTLDYAIAHAVTEFSRLREVSRSGQEAERAGFLAHELRNLSSTATLAFHALETGRVAISGSTGAVLKRTLKSLALLIDRSMASVRLASGVIYRERISVAELMEELRVAAAIELQPQGHRLEAGTVDPSLEVEGDRELIGGALTNLVRNAFKFTPSPGTICLRAMELGAERVRIEVEDECGGLPPGKEEELFEPFVQEGTDRSGLGLGLAISRQSIAACGGEIHLRNLPGKGCVFSVDLPSPTRMVEGADISQGLH